MDLSIDFIKIFSKMDNFFVILMEIDVINLKIYNKDFCSKMVCILVPIKSIAT